MLRAWFRKMESGDGQKPRNSDSGWEVIGGSNKKLLVMETEREVKHGTK